MNCPNCDSPTCVIDSRSVKAKSPAGALRRRRECVGPEKHRFTTYETLVNENTEAIITLCENRIQALEQWVMGVIAGSDGYKWRAICAIAGISHESSAIAAGVATRTLSRTDETERQKANFDAIEGQMQRIAHAFLLRDRVGAEPESRNA